MTHPLRTCLRHTHHEADGAADGGHPCRMDGRGQATPRVNAASCRTKPDADVARGAAAGKTKTLTFADGVSSSRTEVGSRTAIWDMAEERDGTSSILRLPVGREESGCSMTTMQGTETVFPRPHRENEGGP